MATPNYRGEAVVSQGETWTCNEQGVWVRTQKYTGLSEPLKSFASQFPLGNQLVLSQDGATATLTATLGFLTGDGTDSQPIDKWEDDVETIEKDLAFSDLAQAMTSVGQRYLKAYREAASKDEREGVLIDSQELTGIDETNFDILVQEVDRGVESVPVDTIILKRTRTMAVAFVSPRRLTIRQEFYSTDVLVDNENIPADVALSLPTTPYTPPANSNWGWRARLSNRSFVGRGLVEEHSDWVFAAWSTNLYTYVS